MKLIIEDDEGRKTVVPLLRDELSIGRHEDNVVRLTEKNVSRKHARILREQGRFFIEDLQSFTGIRVNGERVLGKRPVGEGDLIEISEYDLVLQDAPDAQRPPPPADEEDDEPTDISGRAGGAARSASEADTEQVRMSDIAGVDQATARDLLPAEQPRLVVLTEPLRGREFVLRRTPTGVGRTRENDVALEHGSVSRHHCQLFLEGETWKILDNRSAQGVKVNGATFAASRVRAGDTLEVGQVKLRFVAPGEAFALPATAQQQPPPPPPESEPPPQGLQPALLAEQRPGSAQPASLPAPRAAAVLPSRPSASRRAERYESADPTIPDFAPPAMMKGAADSAAAGRAAAGSAATDAAGTDAAGIDAAAPGAVSAPSAQPARKQQQGTPRRLFALGAVALAAIALAVVVVVRSRPREPAAAPPDDDGVQVTTIRADVIEAELKRAQAAMAAHESAEAVRHYDAAAKAGATALELRGQAIALAEERAQAAHADLSAAIAAQRWDDARRIAAGLGDARGYWADQIRAKASSIPAAAAASPSAAGAPGAASASPQAQAGSAPEAIVPPRVDARAPSAPLAASEPALAAPTREPAADSAARASREPAPLPAARASAEALASPGRPKDPAPADPDAEARKLIAEGNRKVVARDFEGAIPVFQDALVLKPSAPVLASIYRSMGIAFTQQGNVEEGARYYRLYLPLCTNPKEKQILQQTLDEYETRRR